MQNSAFVILNAPVQEGRTFGSRAFIAQGPVGSKIIFELTQLTDTDSSHLLCARTSSRSNSLLPKHNFTGLRRHAGGQLQFESENSRWVIRVRTMNSSAMLFDFFE